MFVLLLLDGSIRGVPPRLQIGPTPKSPPWRGLYPKASLFIFACGRIFEVGGAEQGVVFGRVRHFDLHEPAFAVGVAVDDGGIGVHGLVEFHDLAAHRKERVAHGLHGLDRAENLACGERLAHGRNIDENDVAQLALGKVGDADNGRVTLDAAPLVVAGVFQICRYVHNILKI